VRSLSQRRRKENHARGHPPAPVPSPRASGGRPGRSGKGSWLPAFVEDALDPGDPVFFSRSRLAPTRDCRARERGHRLRFDSAPLDTGPGATDPCGAS